MRRVQSASQTVLGVCGGPFWVFNSCDMSFKRSEAVCCGRDMGPRSWLGMTHAQP